MDIPLQHAPTVSQDGGISNHVYLRIERRFLSSHSSLASPMTLASSPNPITNSPPLSPDHVYLLSASLQDLSMYSNGDTGWLIHVAKLICEPFGSGQLVTFQTHNATYWYSRRFLYSEWHAVQNGDALEATIYEYRPRTSATSILANISGSRNVTSISSVSGSGNSTTFRRLVTQRDAECIVCQEQRALRASYLIPRRLGDENIRRIFRIYAPNGPPDPLEVHRYHPALGVLLFSSIDHFVDRYLLGFWRVPGPGNAYIMHSFLDNPLELNSLGGTTSSRYPLPVMHGQVVNLNPRDPDINLPPPGIFDWHYLQCVLMRFGTAEHKNTPNIRFHEVSFRTEDDDDDDEYCDSTSEEGQDNENKDPPYPSYRFDRMLTRAAH